MKQTARWADKVEKSKFRSAPKEKLDRGFIGHKSAKMMKKSKVIEARQKNAIESKSSLLKDIDKNESLKINNIKLKDGCLISLDKVSIYYDDIVCKDVSFSINYLDRIALKGKNGSGKSSIVKLIMQEDIKYSGNIYRDSRLKISYVNQGIDMLKGSLNDFIIDSNIDGNRFKSILRKLDFSRNQFNVDMKDYSDGQKKKVLIAKSLCEDAHLYIWDEPLNYVDVLSKIQIEELILEYKPTILFIEHDINFCDKIANKVIEL